MIHRPEWTLEPVSFAPRKVPALVPADQLPPPQVEAWPPKRPAFRLENAAYDGKLIGAYGAFDSDTPLSKIPGVRPSDGSPVTHTILYVNGVYNSPAKQFDSLQAIADRAGAEVIGVHNASDGPLRDLAQALRDRKDLGRNPAVDALSDVMYAELTGSDRDINLMAHSQGAAITSRVIQDVKMELMADGFAPDEVAEMMRRVKVDTFGAAAEVFPDGPSYRHHVNRYDYIPAAVGPGGLNKASEHLGEGAEVTRFNSTKANLHTLDKVYLPEWEPRFEKGPER